MKFTAVNEVKRIENNIEQTNRLIAGALVVFCLAIAGAVLISILL